jgi:hypothetical protein
MSGYLTSVLHLMTAGTGVYWGGYLLLTGIYGVPFSPWYLVVFLGGVILGVGAIIQQFSKQPWTTWLPVLGGGMLGSYFFPAFAYNLSDFIALPGSATSERALALSSVVLTAASLVVALHALHVRLTEAKYR